jgi:hypothetical protein
MQNRKEVTADAMPYHNHKRKMVMFQYLCILLTTLNVSGHVHNEVKDEKIKVTDRMALPHQG